MNAEALQLNYLPSSLGFTNCIFILDFLCEWSSLTLRVRILLDNIFWWFVTSIKTHQLYFK